MRRPLIALVTDFGIHDWYVASMKAVILTRCPAATLVDISHDIPPQDVLTGAFTLVQAVPWFPRGSVFVCVVDPGVGTKRQVIAADADGRRFVGPDNGLMSLVFQRARHLKIVRLTQRRHWLQPVSQTFHGRDLMAPVAARLARGIRLGRLGTPTPSYEGVDCASPRCRGDSWEGEVLHIDRFGNLITNLPGDLLGSASRRRRHLIRYKQRPVRMVSSYAGARSNELIALIGSTGFLELAVRDGSAAARFRARRGDRVILG